MWFNELALGYMKVNHGCNNFCMAQQFFQGNDIKPLFKQMGCITVSEGMKVNFFGNLC